MDIAFYGYRILIELPPGKLGVLASLLILTAVTYLYMKKWRKSRTINIGNFETLKQVSGRKSITSPSLLLVKFLTVVLLFMLATGSIHVYHQEKVSNTDFVLAIDNSFSMETPDYQPTRMGVAKDIAINLTAEIPKNSRVAVISFSGEEHLINSLSRDRKKTVNSIRSIEPDLDTTGTSIGGALTLGSQILSGSGRQKKIVLITDGVNRDNTTISEGIRAAVEENISVHILGLPSTRQTEKLYDRMSRQLDITENITAMPEINESGLSRIASETGGSFYNIEGFESFTKSFETGSLQKNEVEIDSTYYVSILIALIIITELLIYSRYGSI